ncbi:MAG: caspase family protein, partial [Planctomycetes bacterium]|nr:caspase family protein [Planctomycetota bacterium]
MRVAVFCLLFAAAAAAAAEAPPSKGGIALVIGIDGYETLGSLDTCRNDAREFAGVLIDHGGYAPSRVILLTDDAAEGQNRPTLATMRRRILQVARLARRGESLLVYFSGHGITKNGKGFLVPSDGDADNAVSLDWMKTTLQASKASSKILILDACHSGSAAKGVGGIAPSLVKDSTGLVMLLSSAAGEVSYPLSKEKRSVFSKYLVDGLAGKADTDSDRSVTLAELFSYIEESLIDWSLATGKTQTPVLYPKKPPNVVFARVQSAVLSAKLSQSDTISAIHGAGDFSKTVAKVSNAVVLMVIDKPIDRSTFPDELPSPLEDTSGFAVSGCGVIIESKGERGLVLTNSHIVDGATEIVVKLHDGRSFTGALVGTDPRTDLAIVRIEARGLVYIEWGDSDKINCGDVAIVVGLN